jgi:hypothetical protein
MWTSPVATPAPRSRTAQHQYHQQQQQPKTPVHGGSGGGNGDDTYDPDAALRKELARVRAINEAVEAIIATLDRTHSNMNVSCRCCCYCWKRANDDVPPLLALIHTLSHTQHTLSLITIICSSTHSFTTYT